MREAKSKHDRWIGLGERTAQAMRDYVDRFRDDLFLAVACIFGSFRCSATATASLRRVQPPSGGLPLEGHLNLAGSFSKPALAKYCSGIREGSL